MFSRSKLFSELRLLECFFSRCGKSTDAQNVKSFSQIFFEPQVQLLLKKLISVDYQKIFRPKAMGFYWKPPEYKLMTKEELDEEMRKYEKNAEKFLQIPPYLEIREEINEVLQEDTSIDGYEEHHAKMIFTDISADIHNEDRTILVREPNGILRKAHWSERDRMNTLFFPLPGRELKIPKMFEEEHLRDCLERKEYEFILDRACCQFDPDDPLYHKVTSVTYETINQKQHFDEIQSTRHFGALVFYLVINKKVDNMLLFNLNSSRATSACDLVELYHIVHPNCESAKSCSDKNGLECVQEFIKLDSKSKDILTTALNKYLDLKEKEEQMKAELDKAHGI